MPNVTHGLNMYESQSISIVYMFYIYVYTRNVKKDTLSEELSGILTGEVVLMLLNVTGIWK